MVNTFQGTRSPACHSQGQVRGRKWRECHSIPFSTWLQACVFPMSKAACSWARLSPARRSLSGRPPPSELREASQGGTDDLRPHCLVQFVEQVKLLRLAPDRVRTRREGTQAEGGTWPPSHRVPALLAAPFPLTNAHAHMVSMPL